MKQFNINMTVEFEKDLKTYMKARNIKQKADAIRKAFREIVSNLHPKSKFDFRSMIGIGLKSPLNQNPKFKNEDDLWS